MRLVACRLSIRLSTGRASCRRLGKYCAPYCSSIISSPPSPRLALQLLHTYYLVYQALADTTSTSTSCAGPAARGPCSILAPCHIAAASVYGSSIVLRSARVNNGERPRGGGGGRASLVRLCRESRGAKVLVTRRKGVVLGPMRTLLKYAPSIPYFVCITAAAATGSPVYSLKMGCTISEDNHNKPTAGFDYQVQCFCLRAHIVTLIFIPVTSRPPPPLVRDPIARPGDR